MASRKDYVTKKRNGGQPASSSRPAPVKKASQSAAAKSSPAKAQQQQTANKPWKMIIAGLLVIAGISYLLLQLSLVDPKEIRETGISALIESKINQQQVTLELPEAKKPLPNRNTTAKKANKAPANNNSSAKSSERKKSVAAVPVTDKSIEASQKEPYQFYEILAKNTVDTETIAAYKSTPKTANLKNKTLLQTGSFRNQKDAENMKVRLLLNNLPKVTVQKITSANGTWYRVRTGPFITYNHLKAALNKLNKMKINSMQVLVR